MIPVDDSGKQAKPSAANPVTKRSFRERCLLSLMEIFKSTQGYSLGYRTLVFLEFLQYLSFTFNEHIKGLFSVTFLGHIQTSLAYVTFQNFLNNETENHFDITLYSLLGVNAVVSVLMVILPTFLIKTRNQTKNTFTLVCIRFIALYVMIFSTILVLPTIQIAYAAMKCQNGPSFNRVFDCGSSGRVGLRKFAGFILIIQCIGKGFVYNYYSLDLNPLGGSMFTSCSSNIRLAQFTFKLLLPVFFIYARDPTKTSQIVYLVCITLFYQVTTFWWAKTPPLPQFAFGVQIYTSFAILSWASFCVLCQALWSHRVKSDSLCTISFFLGVVLIIFLGYFREKKKSLQFLRMGFSKLKTRRQIENYFYTFSILIERSYNDKDFKNQLFFCLKRLQSEYNNIEGNDKLSQLSEKILSMGAFNSETKTMCYSLLVGLLAKNRSKYPKNSYLNFMEACFLNLRLGMKWKAIYILEGANYSLSESRVQLATFRFISSIEYEMMEQELTNKDNTGFNVLTLTNFQTRFSAFNDQISQAYMHYYNFWSNLVLTCPNPLILKQIGLTICSLNSQIKANFEGMMDQSTSTHVKSMVLYGYYLKLIVNDFDEAEKVITKANNILSSVSVAGATGSDVLDDKKFKNSDSSNLAIITVSGNLRDLGAIKSVNTEAIRLFGYTLEELRGNTIDMLMPKVFAEKHHSLMVRYFEDNKNKSLREVPNVYGRKKNGFIFNCDVNLKMIPYVSECVELMGVISPRFILSEEYPSMVFDFYSGKLLGITSECYYKYGLHPALAFGNSSSGNELNFLQIFPKISSLSHMTELHKIPANQTLDTTILPKLYFIDDSDLGEPFKGDEAFSQHNVKAIFTKFKDFGLKTLNILHVTLKENLFEGEDSSESHDRLSRATKMVGSLIKDEISYMQKQKISDLSKNRLFNLDDFRQDRRWDLDDGNEENEELYMKLERERGLKDKRAFIASNNISKKPHIRKICLYMLLLFGLLQSIFLRVIYYNENKLLTKMFDCFDILGNRWIEVLELGIESRTMQLYLSGRLNGTFNVNSELQAIDNQIQKITDLDYKTDDLYLNLIKWQPSVLRSSHKFSVMLKNGTASKIVLYLQDALFLVLNSASKLDPSEPNIDFKKYKMSQVTNNQEEEFIQSFYFLEENYCKTISKIMEDQLANYTHLYRETISLQERYRLITFFIWNAFFLLVIIFVMLSLSKSYSTINTVYRILGHIDVDQANIYRMQCRKFNQKFLWEYKVYNDAFKQNDDELISHADNNVMTIELSCQVRHLTGSVGTEKDLDNPFVFESKRDMMRKRRKKTIFGKGTAQQYNVNRPTVVQNRAALTGINSPNKDSKKKNGEGNSKSRNIFNFQNIGLPEITPKGVGQNIPQTPNNKSISKKSDSQFSEYQDPEDDFQLNLSPNMPHRNKKKASERIIKMNDSIKRRRGGISNLYKNMGDLTVKAQQKMEEMIIARNTTLSNFNENIRKPILLHILLVLILIVPTKLATLIYDNHQNEESFKVQTHLNTVLQMNAYLKLLYASLLESSVEGHIETTADGKNSIEEAHQRVKSLAYSDLFVPYHGDFPAKFKPYFYSLDQASRQNICLGLGNATSSVEAWKNDTLIKNFCKTSNDLEKGFKTGIYRIIQEVTLVEEVFNGSVEDSDHPDEEEDHSLLRLTTSSLASISSTSEPIAHLLSSYRSSLLTFYSLYRSSNQVLSQTLSILDYILSKLISTLLILGLVGRVGRRLVSTLRVVNVVPFQCITQKEGLWRAVEGLDCAV